MIFLISVIANYLNIFLAINLYVIKNEISILLFYTYLPIINMVFFIFSISNMSARFIGEKINSILIIIIIIFSTAITLLDIILYWNYTHILTSAYINEVNETLFHLDIFLSLENKKYLLFLDFFQKIILSNFSFTLILDDLSLIFLLLTTIIMGACIVLVESQISYLKISCIYLLLILEMCLFNFFLQSNIIIFYFFFEICLIPLFFLIGIWGNRSKKIAASYSFLFFTLVGSVFILFSVIYLFRYYNIILMTDLLYLGESSIFSSKINYTIIYLFLFLGFSIKIPTFPFYQWLPEAHVESPTVGSIILAGLILKLGGHSFIRILLPLINQEINLLIIPFVKVVSVFSMVVVSCLSFHHIDLKKIIAYSSISHMNLSTISLITATNLSLIGGVFSMVSHGFISAALFLIVGILYNYYGTKLVPYFNAVAQFTPVFTIITFLVILANIGFPLTSGFVSEVIMLIGLSAHVNETLLFFIFTSTFFLMINFFWIFNKIFLGNYNNFVIKGIDLLDQRLRNELYCLLLFLINIYSLGIYPTILLSKLSFDNYYNISF